MEPNVREVELEVTIEELEEKITPWFLGELVWPFTGGSPWGGR